MSAELAVCTHCGFTWDEFRQKRLLGCPQCYACFALPLSRALRLIQPELRLRPLTIPEAFSGFGDITEITEEAARLREQLRAQLAEALRHERYEEAAALRKQLVNRNHPSSGNPETGSP